MQNSWNGSQSPRFAIIFPMFFPHRFSPDIHQTFTRFFLFFPMVSYVFLFCIKINTPCMIYTGYFCGIFSAQFQPNFGPILPGARPTNLGRTRVSGIMFTSSRASRRPWQGQGLHLSQPVCQLRRLPWSGSWKRWKQHSGEHCGSLCRDPRYLL